MVLLAQIDKWSLQLRLVKETRLFPVLVYARKPDGAVRGLRYALGMKNLRKCGISRGGLMYTGGVRKASGTLVTEQGVRAP